jgi:hypothetical protein
VKLRLSRIELEPVGPVASRVELAAADFNLIYGGNETGKTCLVEFLIACLFPDDAKGFMSRDWDFRGSVTVEGLADKPAVLKPGRKAKGIPGLLAGSEQFLPASFSRLVFVRGGNISVGASKPGDPQGLENTAMNELLSGRRFLDHLMGQVDKTIQNQKFQLIDGGLTGDRNSPAEKVNSRAETLKRLSALIEDASGSGPADRLRSIEETRKVIQQKLEHLSKAKRAWAAKLASDSRDLTSKLRALPDEHMLAEAAANVAGYEQAVVALDEATRNRDASKHGMAHREWLEAAQKRWGGPGPAEESGSGLPVAAFVFIVLVLASAGLAVAGFPIPAAGAAVVGAVAGLLAMTSIRRRKVDPRLLLERQEVRERFKGLFGRELVDGATLDEMCRRASESANRTAVYEEDINKARIAMAAFSGRMSLIGVGHLSGPDEWKARMQAIRMERSSLQSALDETGRKLARLDVDEADYLEGGPAADWDQTAATTLAKDLQALDLEAETLRKSTGTFQTQAAALLGQSDVPQDMPGLVDALRTQRDRLAAEYRKTTAEALAKLALRNALQKLQDIEDRQIDVALASEPVKDVIRRLTGRYRGISRSPEGISLIANDGEAFSFDGLSTGAAEQVMLALRLGFLKFVTGLDSGFLVLDDSFQHADWKRRELAVSNLRKASDEGWQVFLLTMDRHIRALVENEFLGGAAHRLKVTELG